MLDSEIAYLAMHFGAHLKIVDKENEELLYSDRMRKWGFHWKYAQERGTESPPSCKNCGSGSGSGSGKRAGYL